MCRYDTMHSIQLSWYPVLHLAYASGEYQHIPLWEYRVQSTGRTSYHTIQDRRGGRDRSTHTYVHVGNPIPPPDKDQH